MQPLKRLLKFALLVLAAFYLYWTLALFALSAGSAMAADLSAPQLQAVEPAAIFSGWEFTFTPYLWVPWFSGNESRFRKFGQGDK